MKNPYRITSQAVDDLAQRRKSSSRLMRQRHQRFPVPLPSAVWAALVAWVLGLSRRLFARRFGTLAKAQDSSLAS